MPTWRYIVKGRVQGVGFRYFAQQMAAAFDIGGYTRNLQEGSVEIVASGTEENIRSFLEQIQIGAPHSRVDQVLAQALDEERFAEFTIRS